MEGSGRDQRARSAVRSARRMATESAREYHRARRVRRLGRMAEVRDLEMRSQTRAASSQNARVYCPLFLRKQVVDDTAAKRSANGAGNSGHECEKGFVDLGGGRLLG